MAGDPQDSRFLQSQHGCRENGVERFLVAEVERDPVLFFHARILVENEDAEKTVSYVFGSPGTFQ